MARQAGYDVVIIDPRAVFSAAERFPESECLTAWPDEAMAELGLDSRTAVVTLTHDPKIDDPGLQAALVSAVFYIGCLGSRRTHAARCERLSEAGYSDSQLARIHGPVGLDIGARTPAEIAVSILAQIIAVEAGMSGGSGCGPSGRPHRPTGKAPGLRMRCICPMDGFAREADCLSLIVRGSKPPACNRSRWPFWSLVTLMKTALPIVLPRRWRRLGYACLQLRRGGSISMPWDGGLCGSTGTG